MSSYLVTTSSCVDYLGSLATVVRFHHSNCKHNTCTVLLTKPQQVHITTLLPHTHIGRHCCLWCHITQQDMAKPRDTRQPQQPRTLHTLHTDLQRFQSDGSNVKEAKNYNNVIGPALFSVPLDQVMIHDWT